LIIINSFGEKKEKFLIGDWGLGIGDWGLGVGADPPYPIPQTKPQNPKKHKK